MASNGVVEVKNEKDCLGPTPITAAHVEQGFREYTKDDRLKLVNVNWEIIGAGQGFMSYVLRLTFDWNKDDSARHGSRLPNSAVLKSVSSKTMEKLMENLKLDESSNGVMKNMTEVFMSKAHKSECAAYQLFEDPSKAPVPMARAYTTWTDDTNPDRPPMLLIEDLTDRAVVLGGIERSLNYKQMLVLAEIQANLHVWSLSNKDDKWKEKFDTMEERAKMVEGFKHVLEIGLNKVKETFPDELAKLDVDKTRQLFTPESVLKLHNGYREWMPDVLIHGDFWANNIMFNKLPNGAMGDEVVALIDWQMTGVGNPMSDLGRVLVISFDPELCQAHFEDIIRRYYDTLQHKLGPAGMPKNMTMDRVLHCAQEQAAMNCLMMLLMYDSFVNLVCTSAPGDPEPVEQKQQKLKERTRKLIKYAMEKLDIAVDGENVKTA